MIMELIALLFILLPSLINSVTNVSNLGLILKLSVPVWVLGSINAEWLYNYLKKKQKLDIEFLLGFFSGKYNHSARQLWSYRV